MASADGIDGGNVHLKLGSGLAKAFGSGYLFLEGGFRLRAGKRTVSLKRLVLNTAKRSLSGKVDGTAMTVAKLPPQRAGRDGQTR